MQANEQFQSCTALHDLRLQVHLGVGEEERAELQEISVELRCYYAQMPEADDEGAYICYGALADAVRTLLEGKPYKLIETMGMDSLRVARSVAIEQLGEELAKQLAFWVRIHKLNPPVVQLQGGSSFTCSELPSIVDVK